MLNRNTHGGDILSAQSKFDGNIIDFSVNLNPLGMPDSVRTAIAASAADAVRYPDPLCRDLCAGIAEKDYVNTNWVLCGNGAADIIFRLFFAERPAIALVTAPTFAEYEMAARAAGCAVRYHYLPDDNGFDLSESFLDALSPDIDIAFLCNPNNPTGRLIDPDLMLKIILKSKQLNIRLVVDECFLDLTDSGDNCGLSGFLEQNPHIVILRAFTKSYAIPGIRLGYCLCSDSALMERLAACGQPWSVSIPAQSAGLACLRAPDHPIHAREFLRSEREFLFQGLSLAGVSVFRGEANYLLFRAEGIFDLKERLLSHGILIRSCANYVNLSGDFYRVAVRSRADNEYLIDTIKDVLQIG